MKINPAILSRLKKAQFSDKTASGFTSPRTRNKPSFSPDSCHSVKFPDKIYRHKRRSVYTVLLLSYISILLLTLSSSFIYYTQINRQITAQTEVSRQLLLTRLHTAVEADTTAVEALCNELAFDKTLYQYARGFSNITYNDIKTSLSSKMHNSDVLYDYFVYIKNTDEIITPTIRMSSKQFYDIIYTFADLSYEDFKAQYLDSVHFQSYLPLQNLTLYDDGTLEILPFIQTFPVGNSPEPLGQIICLIDAAKLFSSMELIHQSTGSDVYILNEKNELITASNNAAYLNTDLIDSISSGKVTNDAIISKQTADSTGWKFVVQTPKTLSFTENREFLFRFFLIFVIYLAIGLVLVRFLTNKSYHPISEINRLIQSNQAQELAAPEQQNEFQAIKNTIIHQFQQDKKLNGIIDSQLPYVRSAIFTRMLKGLVKDYRQALERLQELGIVFQGDCFFLLSLELDENSPFLLEENNPEENLLLARLVASNVGNELFEKQFDSYFLDYEQQKSLFIMCPHNDLTEQSPENLLLEASAALSDFLAEKFQLTCYIGISALHPARELPLCLDEACKASEYSRLLHTTTPVLFEKLQNLEHNYYYPPEMEYQLISSLKTGQFQQTKAFINKIFQLNTEGKSLSSPALKGLLFEINSTLLKQLGSIHIAKGEAPVSENYPDIFADISSIDTAREKYFDMIDQICSQRQEAQEAVSRPEKLAASIAAYIQEHAGESWIDLNTLSGEFHVTPQYISNIFKKYQGENVKDCISKVKLNLAKEMLLSSDLSVNEIAQQLGYAGEIGIIRLFKKYEGITPGDFRNLHS